MLTIEQLRAMPAADRAGYLGQAHASFTSDEREAAESRKHEAAWRQAAERQEKRAAEARAYFATLEAAGLWPTPTPTGER